MTVLRVGYFVGNYHRFTGSQRSLYLLVRGLDRTRVEPVVFFPGDGYATRMFRELGVRVVVVDAPDRLQRFGGGLLKASLAGRVALAALGVAPFTLRLARTLHRERIDVLHCNDARGVLLGGPAGKLLRKPVIWHVRGDVRNLGRLYRSAAALMADRIVVVADGVRPSMEQRWWHKCVTVYNGIGPVAEAGRNRDELLAACVPPLSMGRDEMLVVAVGTVAPFKGVHHLVEAMALLAQRGVGGVRLVVVGDVPDPAYGRHLDSQVARHGLTSVRFPGWDHDAIDWIRAADLVCLPTVDVESMTIEGVSREYYNTEGFSRTVLEAMSAGRAVVGCTVVGIPEQVVHGETGLLVPPSNPHALAEALGQLAAGPGLRSRMGEAGRKRVSERFTLAAMVANTQAVYDSLPRPP